MLTPSSADASVRTATAADLTAIGGVHARAWTAAYRDVLPREVLDRLDPTALSRAWEPSLHAPAQAWPHLLVACTGPTVVGFAACARAGDGPGVRPGDAELVALLVDPSHQRGGHASRLLAAAVDRLREDGALRLLAWTVADDVPRREFLVSAGFAEDGASRQLASDVVPGTVHEVRLVAALADPLS